MSALEAGGKELGNRAQRAITESKVVAWQVLTTDHSVQWLRIFQAHLRTTLCGVVRLGTEVKQELVMYGIDKELFLVFT